jgi:hypothetical protein
VIGEQVDLYETLAPSTGSADASTQGSPGTPGREAEDVPVDREGEAEVLPFRKASGQ